MRLGTSRNRAKYADLRIGREVTRAPVTYYYRRPYWQQLEVWVAARTVVEWTALKRGILGTSADSDGPDGRPSPSEAPEEDLCRRGQYSPSVCVMQVNFVVFPKLLGSSLQRTYLSSSSSLKPNQTVAKAYFQVDY